MIWRAVFNSQSLTVWQKHKDLILGIGKKKNPTNFNPFIVNLREHCDLQLSGFVTDEKIDLRKPLFKKKMLCIH